MTFFAGNLLKGNGGYTVWNAAELAELRNAVGWRRRNAAGRRELYGAGGNSSMGSAYAGGSVSGCDFGAKLQACVKRVSAKLWRNVRRAELYGQSVDGANLTISTANATVLLPCATISTANQIVVTAGRGTCRCAGAHCAAGARRAEARAERCFCTRDGRDGAGGRPDVCGGYDRASTWTTW
jgi:hypothetical protein